MCCNPSLDEVIVADPTISLRLRRETQLRLEALGKARDRSPHYLMKAAVERYLEVEEAVEAERRLLEERWHRFELTGETIDHSDVKAWVAGLAGRTAPD